MDNLKFGYPRECTQCKGVKFGVEPFYQEGNDIRLMLIGQDPTISKKQERVKQVLMLDQENSQIKRWLKEVLGSSLNSLTIYATNVVKCNFDKPPSLQGGKSFLQNYFSNCKQYLIEEVKNFKPKVVFTFGEPAHQLFLTILDNGNEISDSMQSAFSVNFHRCKLGELAFDYSPCLHIKTYRVAQVYGDKVKKFKAGVTKYFGT